MEKFINEDFLLENDYSRELYHDYAEKLPLIDFHCHLDPKKSTRTSIGTISLKLGLEPTITNGAQCVPTVSRSATARETPPNAKISEICRGHAANVGQSHVPLVPFGTCKVFRH